MAILEEVYLQPIPNQRTTVVLNGQNITLDIYSITNPMNYNIVYSTETLPINQQIIAGNRQDNLMFCNVYLNENIIIAGMRCVHAAYINQYLTPFVGYIFFYDDTGIDPTYQTLGTTSHLYFSDYDALAIDYADWLIANGY